MLKFEAISFLNNIQVSYMDVEKTSDLKSKFLHSISNDSPISKLWKYRVFANFNHGEAAPLKEKMLEYALKNRLVGEYQTIIGLFGVALKDIPRNGLYGQLKTEMQTTVNRLKIEADQLEQGNTQEEVKIYYKLGEIYAKYGDHKESELYFSKILRKQSSGVVVIKDEDYLWQWGRQVFYLIDNENESSYQIPLKGYQDLQFFAVRVIEDKKNINSTLAIVRDLYKISRKGRGRNRAKVLQNLLSVQWSIKDLTSGGLLCLADLGLLYTLQALAWKNRTSLKKDVKWSSKIEIAYLNSQYSRLFHELEKAYENYGQFNLALRIVFRQTIPEIKKRILNELLSSYESTPVSKVESLTGIKAAQIQSWVKSNPQNPYLWDPITQSVVYYQKKVPLYDEASRLYNILKNRFEQTQRKRIAGNNQQDQNERYPSDSHF